MPREYDVKIRVRYQETDAQGRVHHANFINYFEIGRVELLRAAGLSYRLVEQRGLFLVVKEMTCRYHRPAFYDDLLTLTTTTTAAKGARLEHAYRVTRDEQLLVEGHSVLACVDREGRVRRLPDWLLPE